MRRRSRAGGESNKTRRHKTATPKRRHGSAIDKETDVARHTPLLSELRQRTTDLTESLEQQTATSEIASRVAVRDWSARRVAGYWLADPRRAVEMQASLGRGYLDLWANAVKRMTGQPVEPVATPDSKDRRFTDPEWSSDQFFDFLKQAYLLTSHWADYLVKHAEGLDPYARQKAEFYVRQIANAIWPSNFALRLAN